MTEEADPACYRLVIKGVADQTRLQDVVTRLASQISATPEQIRVMLSAGHYILRSGLTHSVAQQYAEALRASGCIIAVEDERELLAVDLPPPSLPVQPASGRSLEAEEAMIRRLGDYEKASGIFWIILGIFQIISVIGAIAGIWNIAAGYSHIKISRRIRDRDSTVPADFEGVGGLIVIGLVNLLLGGFIGLIFVGFDFFVRDKILSNRALFNRISPQHAGLGTKPLQAAKIPMKGNGWLILAPENRIFGPFTMDEVKQLVADGHVTEATLVRQAKNAKWRKLKDTELNSLLSSEPVPPPI